MSRRYEFLSRFSFLAFLIFGSTQTQAAEKLPLFFNPMVRDATLESRLTSLRFVTVDAFEPFSAFDAGGALRGVHVDLARAICNELKLEAKCTLQVAAFEEVENLLISGQADIALAGLVPSAANRKSLGFSVPYFRFPSKFLVKKNTGLADGATIGVIAGSVQQKMAGALFSNFNQTTYATKAEALTALNSGTISALFGDGLGLAALQSGSNFNCCDLMSENYFLPTLRADTLNATTSITRLDILAQVNAALRQLATDGRLDEIYLRHMPVNPLK
jgi:polar amino acid transport system substrate-binding protein